MISVPGKGCLRVLEDQGVTGGVCARRRNACRSGHQEQSGHGDFHAEHELVPVGRTPRPSPRLDQPQVARDARHPQDDRASITPPPAPGRLRGDIRRLLHLLAPAQHPEGGSSGKAPQYQDGRHDPELQPLGIPARLEPTEQRRYQRNEGEPPDGDGGCRAPNRRVGAAHEPLPRHPQ